MIFYEDGTIEYEEEDFISVSEYRRWLGPDKNTAGATFHMKADYWKNPKNEKR